MGERRGRIRFCELYKSFGDNAVLRGVTITVEPGTVHFVIGPSGTGKTVLIKQLVGLLKPDAGHIYLDDQEVTGLSEAGFLAVRKRCQMIFQHATLFDALDVLENVAMPVRKRFKLPWDEANARARKALEQVHAAAYSARLPSEIGAGVRKRVAIARALALEPEILLYDEPTTSLDPVAARRTDALIREMADRFGLTSVVVSHDLISVRAVADHVTFLLAGQVAFDGPRDALFSSNDEKVREFVHGTAKRWSP